MSFASYTMAGKKSVAALKKALAKAQNEIKQDQMEKAFLKVQEVLQCEEVPNIPQIATDFNLI